MKFKGVVKQTSSKGLLNLEGPLLAWKYSWTWLVPRTNQVCKSEAKKDAIKQQVI